MTSESGPLAAPSAMGPTDLMSLIRSLRLDQFPRYARRLLGLPAARPEDFSVPLTDWERSRLQEIARAARGPNPKPAVFVHGVLPRSGTNFLSDALELHADLCAHPGRLWEFPLLYVAPGATALQREFVQMFKPNNEVMGRFDMLAYLASGWMAALQQEAGDRHILLKCPHVQHINLFRHIFPDDILLLCLRDGRDIVQSSKGTFRRGLIGRKVTSELMREWRYATDAILSFEPGGQNAYGNAMVIRYEALVEQPNEVIGQALAHAGLEPERYDFEALSNLPVRGSSAVTADDKSRWDQHEKPKDFKPVGRWSSWSERQRRQFKSLAGATLIRAGYAADDSW